MNAFEKLVWLQEHANAISVEVNDHRGAYEPIEQAVAEMDRADFPSEDVKAECIKRGQLVVVQCYPLTPIGFMAIAHYDIAAAIERVYENVEPSIRRNQ